MAKLENKKTRLHYDIEAGLTSHRASERIVISCWDDEGREAEIITNGWGDGLWVRNYDGSLSQVCGTCQYHLPVSASGMRKALRRTWEDLYERQDPRTW